MKILTASLIVAGASIVSAFTLARCKGPKQDKADNSEREHTELFPATEKTTPLDLTKPNIPQIKEANRRKADDKGSVTYKDLNGQVHSFDFYDYNVQPALYKAIAKFSTKENPDITDILGFEAEVLKNGLANDASYNGTKTTDPTIVFFKLVDEATKPTSDKGETISVKEYTQMMDAWSGLKI